MGEENKNYVIAKICGEGKANKDFFVFAIEKYAFFKGGVYYKEILTHTKMEKIKISGTLYHNMESGLFLFDDSLIIYEVEYITYEKVRALLATMSEKDIQRYKMHLNFMKQLSDVARSQIKENKKYIKCLRRNNRWVL